MQAIDRRCIVERVSADKNQLIRFVLGPDNLVYADIKGNLPGRGVWVGAKKELVEQAIAKNLFARGFKAGCKIPDDFAA